MKDVRVDRDTFPGSNFCVFQLVQDQLRVSFQFRFTDEDYIDTYDNSILDSMLNDLTLAVENISPIKANETVDGNS